jgi:hypothetical protein
VAKRVQGNHNSLMKNIPNNKNSPINIFTSFVMILISGCGSIQWG